MNVSYRKYHALKGLVLLLGIVLVLLLAFFATTVGVMDTVPLDVPRALISFFQGNLEGNAHYKVIVLMRLPRYGHGGAGRNWSGNCRSCDAGLYLKSAGFAIYRGYLKFCGLWCFAYDSIWWCVGNEHGNCPGGIFCGNGMCCVGVRDVAGDRNEAGNDGSGGNGIKLSVFCWNFVA